MVKKLFLRRSLVLSKLHLASYLVVGALILAVVVLRRWPDQNFHLIACDVGQGDALLLQLRDLQVLIDTGKDDSVLSCLEKYMPFWDKTLELLVITHPDLDHFGGAEAVLTNFDVLSLAQLAYQRDTSEYKGLQALVQRKKIEGLIVFYPYSGDRVVTIDELEINCLWPMREEIEKLIIDAETTLSDTIAEKNHQSINHNDLSLTLLLRYKENTVLLTGDLEERGELALLDKGLMTDVDVLKVGHHGSKTSSHEHFLKKVSPEIAIVSVGKNNTYNHPSREVVSRLEQLVKDNLLRTDQDGDIHLVSNGQTFNLLTRLDRE